MSKLSVNVDHIATLRQARRAGYPDPREAARLAEAAGAAGITVHLRADRRHIQDDDVRQLRSSVLGKLNLEIAASDEMIGLAPKLAPDQVTIVPERPEEVTTEGGLDLGSHGARLEQAAAVFVDNGIEVSFFLDPDPVQIERLDKIPRTLVAGFEINTDRYCSAAGSASDDELERITSCARLGASLGLRVFAGHGLTTDNVGALAALPEIEEFNIGHSIVARSVLVGMERAVEEMLIAIRGGSSKTSG